MSDIFDMASDREMADRELSIKQARDRNQPIKFTGRCLSDQCNAQIEKGRFCDSWCREDYEHGLRMKQIAGKK